MDAKALRDLAQRSDGDFFSEVTKGLNLIRENAHAIRNCALDLRSRDLDRGAEILKLTAEEEAVKFLILLDAVRCPRRSNKDKRIFARQLRYFYDHLARGIYAEYYRFDVGHDFKEVRGFVENERAECYLDGPDFLCWVMPNRIQSRRENKIYVDYLRSESGNLWKSPADDPDINLKLSDSPLDDRVFDLIDALSAIIGKGARALQVIASIWRPLRMQDGTSRSELKEWNSQTIDALRREVSEIRASDEDFSYVRQNWLSPLYDLDLAPLPVPQEEIERILQEEKDAFWRSVI